MPFYLWRFSVLGIPSTVLEMMIYTLFILWVIRKRKYFLPFFKKDFFVSSFKRRLILNSGITLLFLGLTIATAQSTDIKTSFGIFKGWFFDPFLFFIVFVSVIKKREHISLSLTSWLLSGVAVSLIGILYLLNNELTYDGRLSAFFLSPNHLAMYLAPAFLIVLFFLLNRRNLDRKVFSIEYLVLIIFLLIILVPLYFTYSYGAFLGIFMGVLYLLISKGRLSTYSLNMKRKYLIVLFLVFFVSFVFIAFNKVDQVLSSNGRSSLHSRLMIWKAATEILKDNPLLGIGPGTFQDTYLSYTDKFNEPYLEWAVPQPHNIFLAFYLQTGLIGFVGFILILIWFFRRGLKYKNNIQYSCLLSGRQPISTILVSLMIYALIHGLVDTTYWKNDLSLMFWVVVAIAVVSEKNYNNGIER
jgi:O-antigen ligase